MNSTIRLSVALINLYEIVKLYQFLALDHITSLDHEQIKIQTLQIADEQIISAKEIT